MEETHKQINLPLVPCGWCGAPIKEGEYCTCVNAQNERKTFDRLDDLKGKRSDPGELVLDKRARDLNQSFARPRLPWRELCEVIIRHFEKSRKTKWSREEIITRLNILHREFVARYTEEA